MDKKLLERANKISEDIKSITDFIDRMDNKNFTMIYAPQRFFPEELKDLIRPILREYQEKLFCQLKNL